MVAQSNFESFSPSVAAKVDSTPAFQEDFFKSSFRPPALATEATSLYIRPADAPPAPAGIDAAAWSQVSEWTAAGKDVKFTTADSGQVPDYIMGADGKLAKNPAKTAPNPDGSITVQVDNSQGKAAAQEQAKALQVAAVQEKIFYWQRANPGSTSIPEYLKGMLHAAQSYTPEVAAAPENPVQPMPTIQPEAPQVQPGGGEIARPQPASYSGGGDGGGYGGGGGGQRLGNSNIGEAPRSGYRNGSLEAGEPTQRGAIPPPIPGDLPIKGPPSATVEQIQEFLTKVGSPAAKEPGFSQALYDASTERGIDPAVAVGFFLQESTCGKYGRAVENHSLGNIKGRAPESGGTDGTFRKYDSWAEGARDWARLIDESYVQKRGLQTMSQVISVYAPGSDGNNERGYVATVKGVVENFKKQNGTATA